VLELVDKAVLETVAFMLESSSLSLGTTIAPLAQLVRALSLHGRCRWFESIKVYKQPILEMVGQVVKRQTQKAV
jgi:hypothetical protein